MSDKQVIDFQQYTISEAYKKYIKGEMSKVDYDKALDYAAKHIKAVQERRRIQREGGK